MQLMTCREREKGFIISVPAFLLRFLSAIPIGTTWAGHLGTAEEVPDAHRAGLCCSCHMSHSNRPSFVLQVTSFTASLSVEMQQLARPWAVAAVLIDCSFSDTFVQYSHKHCLSWAFASSRTFLGRHLANVENGTVPPAPLYSMWSCRSGFCKKEVAFPDLFETNFLSGAWTALSSKKLSAVASLLIFASFLLLIVSVFLELEMCCLYVFLLMLSRRAMLDAQ